MEVVREQPKSHSNESLELAIAMAFIRSKLLHKPPSAPPPPPSSSAAVAAAVPQPVAAAKAASFSSDDALKWKRKAKERKREILRLKEDLKVAEDGSQYDLYPKSASCKCYFFDKLGLLSPKRIGDSSDQRFSDVLRRRFLRQVRIKGRKRRRTDDSLLHRISERDNENNVEQLSASVDFLLELCDTISPQSLEEGNSKNWCHQAVDFILGTLATMSPTEKNREPVEGIVNSLIMRLLRRMCSALQGDDSLLFMDPFDDAFPSMNNSMYMMIQLIEFLVTDYLLTWSNSGDFDIGIFEEWVESILHGRKALELLENRNSLYVLYIDRVIGVVAKQVGQFSFLPKLSPQILENLFN